MYGHLDVQPAQKVSLTHCMLGNFPYLRCRLLTFFQNDSFLILGGTLSAWLSNGSDPYQDQHSVDPDLGPNCLQRVSADDKSCPLRQIVNIFPICLFLIWYTLYIIINHYAIKKKTDIGLEPSHGAHMTVSFTHIRIVIYTGWCALASVF